MSGWVTDVKPIFDICPACGTRFVTVSNGGRWETHQAAPCGQIERNANGDPVAVLFWRCRRCGLTWEHGNEPRPAEVPTP